MTADKQAGSEAVTKVTVEKGRNGQYFFALTFRGVTYPVKGPFANPMLAAAAGQATVKALEAQANGRKA
ncbi:UNVERIFIED_ORG: hypothetical protein LHK14_00645 [Roseateles sp. XES5]|uniref:hypothetical protein n=1 Tax=Shinella sp. G-2 TaxID=3133141 RepID=UPI001D0352E0|nr:hypothetical protein [Roseateles sp. XES5]